MTRRAAIWSRVFITGAYAAYLTGLLLSTRTWWWELLIANTALTAGSLAHVSVMRTLRRLRGD